MPIKPVTTGLSKIIIRTGIDLAIFSAGTDLIGIGGEYAQPYVKSPRSDNFNRNFLSLTFKFIFSPHHKISDSAPSNLNLEHEYDLKVEAS